MSTIEVFADVRCPFTHVGLRRLVARRDDLGSDVGLRIRAWPLELVNDAPLDGELIAEEVDALRARVAPDLFAGFDPSRFPRTSLPALALTADAYGLGDEIGERVALALRWAFFEHGRDIAMPEVLHDIAHDAGVAWPGRHQEEQIRADWAEGQRRGVIGSPHFFIGREGFFCPTLDIVRVNGELQITDDGPAFERFVDRALERRIA